MVQLTFKQCVINRQTYVGRLRFHLDEDSLNTPVFRFYICTYQINLMKIDYLCDLYLFDIKNNRLLACDLFFISMQGNAAEWHHWLCR